MSAPVRERTVLIAIAVTFLAIGAVVAFVLTSHRGGVPEGVFEPVPALADTSAVDPTTIPFVSCGEDCPHG